MAESSVAHPAHPYTREQRGIALYSERGDEVRALGHGRYSVPSCTGGSYVVDLAPLGGEESCTCRDFERRGEPCKHMYCATLYRAKRRAGHRRSSSRPRFSPEQIEANLERMGT